MEITMALSFARYAYHLSSCRYWPSLTARAHIPGHLKSKLAQKERESRLGLGLVEAVSHLLCGPVTLGRDPAAPENISVTYTSNRGGERVASAEAGCRPALWRGVGGMKGAPMLCVVEAVRSGGGAFPEVGERWKRLLDELVLAVGHEAPYVMSEIQTADAHSTPARHAVMALTDSIYFALKEADARGTHRLEDAGGLAFKSDAALFRDVIGQRAAVPEANPGGRTAGGLRATLEGLVATGGTALLVGPTGTFKTTTAVQAAQAAGAALTVVKGRPGIEDRDFFGGVTPTAGGPAWVDGPVSEAFRKAAAGPSVLLVDELLRFEPVFLGALVGLLDPAPPEELAARGIAAHSAGAHYVAELPTGEKLAAPCAHLTLIATTNMGDQYAQAGSRIDAALLGRFEIAVDVEEPDPDVRRSLYEAACAALTVGADMGADLLEALEVFAGSHHMDQGGLLERRAHPRLMLSMARQIGRLEAAGLAPGDAAVEATRVTLATYCAQRGANGLLDPAGVEVLLDGVRELSSQLISSQLSCRS